MNARPLVALAITVAAFVPAVRALPLTAEVQKAFSALNTNLDTSVSAKEWESASRALFQDADSNKDGFLALPELGNSPVVVATFSIADENRDQKLDLKEYLRLRQATFNSADLDRDDGLTFFEFELFTLLSETGWTDANRNGRMEASELKAALAIAFGQLDKDKDGKLIASELIYMSAAQFRVSDQIRDSSLTQDEFTAGYLTVLGAV